MQLWVCSSLKLSGQEMYILLYLESAKTQQKRSSHGQCYCSTFAEKSGETLRGPKSPPGPQTWPHEISRPGSTMAKTWKDFCSSDFDGISASSKRVPKIKMEKTKMEQTKVVWKTIYQILFVYLPEKWSFFSCLPLAAAIGPVTWPSVKSPSRHDSCGPGRVVVPDTIQSCHCNVSI